MGLLRSALPASPPQGLSATTQLLMLAGASHSSVDWMREKRIRQGLSVVATPSKMRELCTWLVISSSAQPCSATAICRACHPGDWGCIKGCAALGPGPCGSIALEGVAGLHSNLAGLFWGSCNWSRKCCCNVEELHVSDGRASAAPEEISLTQQSWLGYQRQFADRGVMPHG